MHNNRPAQPPASVETATRPGYLPPVSTDPRPACASPRLRRSFLARLSRHRVTTHTIFRLNAALACLITALTFSHLAPQAHAQDLAQDVPPEVEPYQGREVTDVRIEGLRRVDERFARNQLRTTTGRPLDWRTVQIDLRNLERLGEFRRVEAFLEVDDDLTVAVVFRVEEAAIIEDVEVVGNRALSDAELLGTIAQTRLLAGVTIDDYRIGAAARAIEQAYRDEGFYQADVTFDEREFEDSGLVIFRIREGERLRITSIRFEGNRAFTDRVLREEVRSRVADLLNDGPLDDAILEADIRSLINFYSNRGYLDVRVGHEILPSPDGREAIVTFIVDEGPLYVLRAVEVVPARANDDGLDVLSPEQVKGLLTISPGDVFSQLERNRSVDAVRDALRQMGYIDAEVDQQTFKDPDTNEVDLRLAINEGRRYKTGLVLTTGHDTTQSRVIRRETELLPGHYLDGTAIDETELRLRRTRIFRGPAPGYPGPRVVPQPVDPRYPAYRDVLIEVDETRTGSLGFGASIGSDQGVVGAINLVERNFDLYDTPDSIGEFLRGESFRGAGQTFNLAIQPGNQVSTFSVGLSEPALFESDYAAGGNLFFRTREFDEFDEQRFGGRLSFSRSFGTRWSGGLNLRGEAIDVSNIDETSTVDLFDVEGENALTSIGFSLSRNTTDDFVRPTRGTNTRLGVEQVGALGGDFDYTRLSIEHAAFLKVDEDYLGRPTVLRLSAASGWIIQEDQAPLFEREFLGGRSFRGFDFRGIGPVGLRNDTGQPSGDQVGGDFSFFLGAELQRPLVQDIVTGVVFLDTGTVVDDIALDDYRVAAGFGVRISVPQLGPVPIALDFGFPIVSEDTDDTRIFSFFVDVPF
jgi:outer membrane protein insertion porin family